MTSVGSDYDLEHDADDVFGDKDYVDDSKKPGKGKNVYAKLDGILQQMEPYAHFIRSGLGPVPEKLGNVSLPSEKSPKITLYKIRAVRPTFFSSFKTSKLNTVQAVDEAVTVPVAAPVAVRPQAPNTPHRHQRHAGSDEDASSDTNATSQLVVSPTNIRPKSTHITDDSTGQTPGLVDADNVNLIQQPHFITNGTLRGYQLDGVSFLYRLWLTGINGILADEMGLGKTVQSISLLAHIHELVGVRGHHLVVVPLSTMNNWMNEFARWYPSSRVVKLHGTAEDRHEIMSSLAEDPSQFDVVLTTYEVAVIERHFLKRFDWYYNIVDEAHRIKNERSKLSEVLRFFDSKHRLLLTGTPLQNNLRELWALLNFLRPDVFASAEEFEMWFARKSDKLLIRKLHTVLKPFMLRRQKVDVESLPPKEELRLYVKMPPLQRKVYKSVLANNLGDLLHELSGSTGDRSERVRLVNLVMQLRKVCNHPYLFEGVEPQPYVEGEHLVQNSGKLCVLDKLLTRLFETTWLPKGDDSRSRILLFSQMTRNLDILEDYCQYRKWKYLRLDGSTPAEMRQVYMDQFNAPGSDSFIFLLSTRAGGLGINLAAADTVVLYDSDWNPQMDLQAQDRAHRIGQKRKVRVFRFVTDNSVEEKIIERAEKKLQLDALVIQQGRLVDKDKLTKADLLSMVKYGADRIFEAVEDESQLGEEDIDAILEYSASKTKKASHSVDLSRLDLSMDHETSLASIQQDMKDLRALNSTLEQDSGPTRRELERVEARERTQEQIKAYNERMERRAAKTHMKRDYFQFWPSRIFELDAILDAGEQLTDEQADEFDRLEALGFGEWRKYHYEDFCTFVKLACGRPLNFQEIAKKVEFPEEEVRRYHTEFLKRFDTLPEKSRILRAIERNLQTEKKNSLAMELVVAASKMKESAVLEDLPASVAGTTWGLADAIILKHAHLAYSAGVDAELDDWRPVWEAVMYDHRLQFDWGVQAQSIYDVIERGTQLVKALVQRERQRIAEQAEEPDKKRSQTDTKPKKKRRRKKKKQEPAPPSSHLLALTAAGGAKRKEPE